jgi:hypothetical protein
MLHSISVYFNENSLRKTVTFVNATKEETITMQLQEQPWATVTLKNENQVYTSKRSEDD